MGLYHKRKQLRKMLPQNVNLGSHHLLFKSVFFHCSHHSSFDFFCCDLNHINSQNDQDSRWRRVYQILIRAPSVRIAVLFHMIDLQFFGASPIIGIPGALRKGVMLWFKLRNSSKLGRERFTFKNQFNWISHFNINDFRCGLPGGGQQTQL